MGHVNRAPSLDIVADGSSMFSAYVVGQFAASQVSDGGLLWLIDRGTLRPNDRFEGIVSAPAIDGPAIYVGGEHEVYSFKKS